MSISIRNKKKSLESRALNVKMIVNSRQNLFRNIIEDKKKKIISHPFVKLITWDNKKLDFFSIVGFGGSIFYLVYNSYGNVWCVGYAIQAIYFGDYQ